MRNLILLTLLLVAVPNFVFAQADGGSGTYEIVASIISIVFMVLSYFFKNWKDKVNNKLGEVAEVTDEKTKSLNALVQAVAQSFNDGKLTSNEIKNVEALAKDFADWSHKTKDEVKKVKKRE